MTGASGEKMPMKLSEKRQRMRAVKTVQTSAARTVARMPWWARSSRPAPMFCPTKAVMPAARLWVGRKARESSLLPTFMPAVKALPKEFTLERIAMVPRDTMDICSPAGRPMRTISRKRTLSSFPRKRRIRSSGKWRLM